MVYIQTEISWTISFAIPTACLALTIIIFLIGRHTYIYKKPQGSVFVDLEKIISAPFRKRTINLQSNTPQFIHAKNKTTKLEKTNRLRYLDKAAVIVDPIELNEKGHPKNTWRLCAVLHFFGFN